MTRPTLIFFGPDGVGHNHKKIYVRTLLYSTADKGNYIQNMFIRLQRGEAIQNFNVWVYGDKELARGSGLFISKNGLSCNHHFLLPKDGVQYDFLHGEYVMQVFVECVNKPPRKIFEQTLMITPIQYEQMKTKKTGIFYDWAPNTQNYFSHIDNGPSKKEDNIDVIRNILD